MRAKLQQPLSNPTPAHLSRLTTTTWLSRLRGSSSTPLCRPIRKVVGACSQTQQAGHLSRMQPPSSPRLPVALPPSFRFSAPSLPYHLSFELCNNPSSMAAWLSCINMPAALWSTLCAAPGDPFPPAPLTHTHLHIVGQYPGQDGDVGVQQAQRVQQRPQRLPRLGQQPVAGGAQQDPPLQQDCE
jgi:hypothetical protein